MKCRLAMPSYTHAIHAKRVLISSGCSASVERIQNMNSGGCGFEIQTDCPCERAVEICRENNILPERIIQGDAT